MTTRRQARWYFDFISPFAYLQFKQFARLPDDLEIELVPILFAGLLNHFGHKGPAEIPAKRIQTYRYCHWQAARLGIRFRAPPAHPFNPLAVLRLAIATDVRREVVRGIFEYVWGEGGDVHSSRGFERLVEHLGIPDAGALIEDPAVKARLRQNTDAAIAEGVYGVPTFAMDGELFWGADLTDMFLDFLADPELLQGAEMQRLARLPVAAERSA